MDEILQILILVIVPITNFFVIRHTKTWLNPLTIISVVFFLPLIFALSRFAGLRCPSEHLALRWSDINWERSRMIVQSPKTEHHEGG